MLVDRRSLCGCVWGGGCSSWHHLRHAAPPPVPAPAALLCLLSMQARQGEAGRPGPGSNHELRPLQCHRTPGHTPLGGWVGGVGGSGAGGIPAAACAVQQGSTARRPAATAGLSLSRPPHASHRRRRSCCWASGAARRRTYTGGARGVGGSQGALERTYGCSCTLRRSPGALISALHTFSHPLLSPLPPPPPLLQPGRVPLGDLHRPAAHAGPHARAGEPRRLPARGGRAGGRLYAARPRPAPPRCRGGRAAGGCGARHTTAGARLARAAAAAGLAPGPQRLERCSGPCCGAAAAPAQRSQLAGGAAGLAAAGPGAGGAGPSSRPSTAAAMAAACGQLTVAPAPCSQPGAAGRAGFQRQRGGEGGPACAGAGGAPA